MSDCAAAFVRLYDRCIYSLRLVNIESVQIVENIFVSNIVQMVASSWITKMLLVAAAVGLCGGAIYKWVDEKGVTHYSESPPSAGKAQQIEGQTTPPHTREGATQDTKSWQQKEEEFRKRHQARQEQEQREFEERQESLAFQDFLKTVPVPGQTGATAALQLNVLSGLRLAFERDCYRYRIRDTEVLEVNQATKWAVERWTLEACGKTKQFEITFTPAGPGRGTNFVIRDLSRF